MLDGSFYVAPRIGDVARQARAVRRARCGHNVYVSQRGLDAIGRQAKRLMCAPCYRAVRAEQGARFAGVWWMDGGEESAA